MHTCELLPGVLNDSTSFIYSGNENPNRLLLRCYNFLPFSTYVLTYVLRARIAASPRPPDIRYVIALGYGTNVGSAAVKYRNEWISGSAQKLPARPALRADDTARLRGERRTDFFADQSLGASKRETRRRRLLAANKRESVRANICIISRYY